MWYYIFVVNTTEREIKKMRTKQEILEEVEWRKEFYENSINRYKEIIPTYNFKTDEYKVYVWLKQIEEAKLEVINDLLDFINKKVD